MTRRLRGPLAALACAGGCVLDFDEFRVPSSLSDIGGQTEAGIDASLDAGAGVIDQPVVSPDVPTVDLSPSTDQGDPRCAPPDNAMIRVAHMAVGLGAVDVCMRRQNSNVPFAPVPSNEWPAAGVGYALVSQHFALDSRVVTTNDRWQFSLVPHGAGCASPTAVAVASLTVNISPQSLSTLLFTSEFGADGRVFGVLGLLSDQTCTYCPSNTLDVRAVHASLGSSTERVNLSINYSLPPPGPQPFVNVLFANNIPYGQTAPVGGAGFDCDTAWRGAADLPSNYSVQFAAQGVAEDVIARSERVGLKAHLLLQSRMATVFFAGGDGVRTPGPEFVLCYEGARDAGMTVCDRLAATAIPRPLGGDAGVPHDSSDVPVEPVDADDDDVLL